MSINPTYLLAALAVALLAITIYFAKTPIQSAAGDVQIPTRNNLVFSEPKDAPDGTAHIHTKKPIPAGADLFIDVLHGGLSERPEQRTAREEAGVEVTYSRNRPFYRINTGFPFDDWGTFAAGRTGAVAESTGIDSGREVFGLRASPIRLVFGTCAPDILLAPHDFGLGLSVFPPADLWGPQYSHWGLGAGRLYSTAGQGHASTIIYLSFSTFDP